MQSVLNRIFQCALTRRLLERTGLSPWYFGQKKSTDFSFDKKAKSKNYAGKKYP